MPDREASADVRQAEMKAHPRGVVSRLPSLRPPFHDVPGPFQRGPHRDTSLGDHPTQDQDRGMRAFWWDGFWANIPETILANYLGLYIIALGASTAKVGLIASLSSLFAALAFFPGARFVEVFGHRKQIVLAFGGGIARIALFGLALVPFWFGGNQSVWIVIALVSIRGFAGYFGLPAWTSLVADLVPMGMRGQFFASRNFGMSIAALATAPIAGIILDRYSGLGGWQIVWLIAFVAGGASTLCFARIPEPATHVDDETAPSIGTKRNVLTDILSDRNFVVYLAATLIWNTAIQAAGPFFNPYLAENLHASRLMIGFLTAIIPVTGLVGLVYFGRVMDVRGTKWLMVVTGLAIPLLPAAWLLVAEPWHTIPIEIAAGVLWAGYGLASLNMVMVMAPTEKRARYAAAFQTVTFAGAFGGPLLGGYVIGAFGFHAVFALSAIGRMIGTLILLRFVRLSHSGPGQPADALAPA